MIQINVYTERMRQHPEAFYTTLRIKVQGTTLVPPPPYACIRVFGYPHTLNLGGSDAICHFFLFMSGSFKRFNRAILNLLVHIYRYYAVSFTGQADR